MTLGEWRDSFPRVTLTLPGADEPLDVEFIVDTGFEGGITLPGFLIRRLNVGVQERRLIQLAGGFEQMCYSYETVVEWEGQRRRVEVLTLEGSPLLGNDLWMGWSIRAENSQDGEVLFEPL